MRRILPIQGSMSRSFFPKLFLTLILISVVPLIVVSTVIYMISKNNLEIEVNRSNLDTLKQTQVALDNILESTEQVPYQIARARAVQDFFNKKIDNPSGSNQIIIDTVNVADSLKVGMNYIEGISIYSYLNNIMVSSGTRDYKSIDKGIIEEYRNSQKSKVFSIWIEPGDTDIYGDESSTIQLIEFILENYNKPQGLVITKIKNDDFAKTIREMNIRKTGYIFVTNDKGNIILSGNNNLSEIIPSTLISKYVNKSEGFDTVEGNNGRRFLISYTTSRYNKWKYIALLPADELDDKAYLIGRIILILCILFTLLAVFLSYAATKGIYNPIQLMDMALRGETPRGAGVERMKVRNDEFGRINREIGKIIDQLTTEKSLKSDIAEENFLLKKKLSDNITDLKKYFLYRLIYGDISNKQEIDKQAEMLSINANGTFVVLILELDKNFNKVMEGLDKDQKSTIKSGIIEVVEKAIANVAVPVKIVYETNESNDKIVAIVDFDNTKSEMENMQNIKLMCNFIQNIIFSNFKYSVTISMGRCYRGLESIQKSYSDAVKALKYKFILGSNTIISKSEIEEDTILKPREYHYKRQLKNCLSARNTAQIFRILNEFKINIKGVVHPDINYVFYCRDIINALLEYLNESGYQFADDKNELNDVFINFENKFENIDDAVAWLCEFIDKVFKKQDDHNPELNKLVEKAIVIIEKEYDKDITLSYICENLGVSEPYFSKIFKDELGKNFKEYLTEYKISKAKDMLKNTSMPIYEIAGKVGYNNHNQFAKMFKKYEGITPQEYRNME